MKKVLKEETRSLSNYELNVLLPILMKGLKTKKGKMNAVTSKKIIDALRNQGLKINYRSVYMLINHIRMNDLIVGLMGSSTGYYIGSNEQDLIDYEVSLLRREEALKKVRMSIKRQRNSMVSLSTLREPQLF